MKADKVTIHTLQDKKARGEKIAMLTAYDASFARLLDESHIDVLLVGDSVGMVVQGHDTTLPVTLDEMVYHSRAVARASRRAHVVADMPFMSYQASLDEAVNNAGRLIKEGGAGAVKIEGGARCAELVSRLASVGIPVMGHIGLTPQSFHQMGGFRVQGRDREAAEKLFDDARALEEAGAYSLVLEGIPREIAADITSQLSIPTIGIGAGPACDGQVLVIHDLLGMNDTFSPKFVRRYEHLATRIRTAVEEYASDVRAGSFPAPRESFSLRGGGENGPAPARVTAIADVGGCSAPAGGGSPGHEPAAPAKPTSR